MRAQGGNGSVVGLEARRRYPNALVPVVGLLLAVALAPGGAVAHAKNYTLFQDCAGSNAPSDCSKPVDSFSSLGQCQPPAESGPYGPGSVCFPAWHLEPYFVSDGSWYHVLTINDYLVSPVAIFACQDNDLDGMCGEAGDFAMWACAAVVLWSDYGWQYWKPTYAYAGGTLLTWLLCGAPVPFGLPGPTAVIGEIGHI